MVLDSQRATTTNEYWSYSQNNVSAYRFRLGEKDLSEYEIRVTSTRLGEYLYHLTNALKSTQALMPYVLGNSNISVQGSEFVLGQRVDRNNSDEALSSVIDKTRNKLLLDIGFSSSPAANKLYVYSVIDKEMEIKPGMTFKNVPTISLLKSHEQELQDM